MENMLGKIVLEKNKTNPRVIIWCNDKSMRGLELVREDSNNIASCDIVKDNSYHGSKLENISVDYENAIDINVLNIRTIGKFTEKGYLKLIRSYISHHSYNGGTNASYLFVRADVHDNFIKMLKR